MDFSYEEEIKSLNSDTGYANTYEATEFASKVKAGFNYFVNNMAHVQFEYAYNYVDTENEIFESFDAHSYMGRVVLISKYYKFIDKVAFRTLSLS